jgi:four helix bundle protein
MSVSFERRIHQQDRSSLQELDETAYWLELLVEGDLVKAEKLEELQRETDELTAIFVASVKTAKSKR